MVDAPKKKHVLNVRFLKVRESMEDEYRSKMADNNAGLVRGAPGGFTFMPTYAKHAQDVYNTPLRTDDTWVVTFPKCGTTWTQELVWLVANGANFEAAKAPLPVRSPFLEFPYMGDVQNEGAAFRMMAGGLDTVAKLSSPRVIKSHLPLYLLNPSLLDTCKVVYVARNPKDVIVSFYHHQRLVKDSSYSGTLAEFADIFMRDLVPYAPFFAHMLEAWNQRQHRNLHFVFYEDLKKDLRGEIKKVADFMEKPLSDEQLDLMTQHLRFDSFSKNEAVNMETPKKMGLFNEDGNFCRKGKTGDWKNHFDAQLNARIDNWIKTNLAGTDLKFVTELEQQD